MSKKTTLIDETGNQYGNYSVLGRDEEKPGRYWWCQCICGKIFSVSGSHLRRGVSKGCRNCRYLTELIYNLLNIPENRNIKWTEEYLPLTVAEKTKWQCTTCEKTWESTKTNTLDHNQNGCPHCYGNFPKTPEDYHTLAKERSFKWRGPEVPNVSTKTEWECGKGHTWWTRYSDIKNAKEGYGCPHCSGLMPKISEDYHTIAETRNLLWISPEIPKDTSTKTQWECKTCGHKWWTYYAAVYHMGTGCPECANSNRYGKGYVYLIAGTGGKLGGTYKVGYSKTPKIRNGKIKCEYDIDHTELLCAIKTSNMGKLEDALHDRYKDYNIEGEWFDLPAREVGYIKMLASRELVEAEDIGRL